MYDAMKHNSKPSTFHHNFTFTAALMRYYFDNPFWPLFYPISIIDQFEPGIALNIYPRKYSGIGKF